MNASHGEPPFDPAAHPGPQGAVRPPAPSGPGQGGQPTGQEQVGAPYPPQQGPPAYQADQAFAAGAGLHWAPISKRHALHRLVTAVLWAIPVGGVGAFIVWRNGTVVAASMWVAAVVLGIILTWVVAELDRRAYGYAERGDDLIVTHGVFVRRLIVVPYGRMQFVDVTAGLLERWMGVATIRMHTAAAATDATIPGLPTAEAALLRDRLAQKGEERSMGL
ncbi:PH domain-containing protein [Actinomadura sp. DSM 109109]|nr:PH domain-containing protein [Actinomadura lepetitiana]